MKKFLYSLLLTVSMLGFSAHAFCQVELSITATIAPPPLLVYDQPECPVDGYLWTPGYWAYGDDGYYWVPGVWVDPPQPYFLWTPCYWGFIGGVYAWNRGYWGPHVGFYGGVNYGYGYNGRGFGGGRWHEGHFRYNTAVMNVNRTVIHNTYIDRTVINKRTNHTSFNGGLHGIQSRPNLREKAAMSESHTTPTHIQSSHDNTARNDKGQYATTNQGRPATVTMNTIGGSKFGQKVHPITPVSPNPRPSIASPTHSPITNNDIHKQQQPMHDVNINPAIHPFTPTNQPNGSNRSKPLQQAPKSVQPPQQHAAPQQHSVPQQRPMQQSTPQQPTPQQRSAVPQQQHSMPQQHTPSPAQKQTPRLGEGREHGPR